MATRFSTLGRYPTTRMRRNRREDWSRRLVAETKLSVDDLIWPVFVQEGENERTPVDSMPGVDRLTIDLFVEAAKEARDLGIPAVAIFPETDPKAKTPDAREAYNPDNLVCRAIRAAKTAVSGIGIVCDVALDPFNSGSPTLAPAKKKVAHPGVRRKPWQLPEGANWVACSGSSLPRQLLPCGAPGFDAGIRQAARTRSAIHAREVGFVTAWSCSPLLATSVPALARNALRRECRPPALDRRPRRHRDLRGALAHWPLLVDLAAEAALAAGFCGYMAGAVRPNAYYRRRLPTA